MADQELPAIDMIKSLKNSGYTDDDLIKMGLLKDDQGNPLIMLHAEAPPAGPVPGHLSWEGSQPPTFYGKAPTNAPPGSITIDAPAPKMAAYRVDNPNAQLSAEDAKAAEAFLSGAPAPAAAQPFDLEKEAGNLVAALRQPAGVQGPGGTGQGVPMDVSFESMPKGRGDRLADIGQGGSPGDHDAQLASAMGVPNRPQAPEAVPGALDAAKAAYNAGPQTGVVGEWGSDDPIWKMTPGQGQKEAVKRYLAAQNQEQQALRNEAGTLRSGIAESQKLYESGVRRMNARMAAEEAAQKAEQLEIAHASTALQNYANDLMTKKVDPYRLLRNGGIIAAAFMTFTDSMNAGISWVYGKSPGEMGGGQAGGLAKVDKMIQDDTEHQFRDIQEGRANVNAGAQLLAQRQNIYRDAQMARHEMNMAKWNLVLDGLKQIRQQTTDKMQADQLDKLVAEAQGKGAEYARAWYSQLESKANSAAAAVRAQKQQKFENAYKIMQLDERRYEADQENAARAGHANVEMAKQDAEQQRELEKKLVAIPGGEGYMEVGGPDQKSKIEAQVQGYQSARNILRAIRSTREALNAEGISLNQAKAQLLRKQLDAQVNAYELEVKNNLAKSGASYTEGEKKLNSAMAQLDELRSDTITPWGMSKASSALDNQERMLDAAQGSLFQTGNPVYIRRQGRWVQPEEWRTRGADRAGEGVRPSWATDVKPAGGR